MIKRVVCDGPQVPTSGANIRPPKTRVQGILEAVYLHVEASQPPQGPDATAIHVNLRSLVNHGKCGDGPTIEHDWRSVFAVSPKLNVDEQNARRGRTEMRKHDAYR